MQSILAFVRRSISRQAVRPVSSRPVELDAQACRAVAGGLPRNTWSLPSGSTSA